MSVAFVPPTPSYFAGSEAVIKTEESVESVGTVCPIKNPPRCVDPGFGTTPIHLVTYQENGQSRFAHWDETNQTVLPEMTAEVVREGSIGPFASVLKPEDVPQIPECVFEAPGETNFFVFDVPVIALGACSLQRAQELAPDGAKVYPYTDETLWIPLPGPVVLVACRDEAQNAKVAARAMVAGVPVTGLGPTRRIVKVKHAILKWIKDCDFMAAVSRIVEQLPCQVDGPKPGDVSWTGIVYDSAMNVPRTMMFWGVLAGWMLKRTSPEEGYLDVCEPLKSYMTSLDAYFAAEAVPALTYNTCAKLTAEQADHAMRVFYWCALHPDDGSRPFAVEAGRRVLEMYLGAGHAILKKRAYRFRNTKRAGGAGRESRTAAAAA